MKDFEIFYYFIWNKILLCSPDLPETYYLDQAELELKKILLPLSA